MEKQVFRQNKQVAYNQILFILYTVITTIVYVLPYTKLRVPYVLAAFLMLAPMPFLLLRRDNLVKYAILLIGVSLVLFFGYLLFCDYPLAEAINEAVRNLRFFMPVLWGFYALRYCSNKQRAFFLVVFLLMTFFILINTLQALQQDPWVARLLAQSTSTSSGELNSYRLRNVGGFEFSYMMGIVTLCFVWLLLSASKIWLKLISAALVIVSFYYIIQCQYTTLLLLAFIGSALLIFLHTHNLYVRILLVIGGIALIMGLAPLFQYLSDVFAGSLLSSKFSQMADALTSHDANQLGSRPELMLQSIQNWLNSPFFGGNYENSNAHSMLLGILEHNGLIGLGLWGYLFVQSWKKIRNVLKEKGLSYELFNIAVIYVCVLALFNPIGYVFEVTIACYFLVPIWISVFQRKQQAGSTA